MISGSEVVHQPSVHALKECSLRTVCFQVKFRASPLQGHRLHAFAQWTLMVKHFFNLWMLPATAAEVLSGLMLVQIVLCEPLACQPAAPAALSP